MPNRENYKTRQRDLIRACLEKNKTRHLTVDAIMAFFKAEGDSVGLTTVYRNLDKLVKEGSVLRYSPPSLGMPACYQYVGNGECYSSCYHLVCTDCGRMTHLSCNQLDNLSEHIRDSHNFDLDNNKTVLYGRCKNCVQEKSDKHI